MSVDTVKWSFSGLKDYVNCPRQYYETKVAKSFVKAVTVQMRYGTEVHKALEDYTAEGKPLPKNYQRFKAILDEFLAIPGTKYPEHRMALRIDRTPCKFGDEDYWVRGIADLLIVDGDTAYVVDYKTGSNKYPDPDQLKLMALMTFAHFPEVNHVKGGLMFVMHNSFISEDYTRDDIDSLWAVFSPKLQRLAMSVQTNSWPENPTPLCGWCPVKTCKFHKER